ncbi:phage recombination protein Bet [Neisseria bergeri]|uniref:phage recombination protein Bet n=1 Tax=Neisseria bergeri TaxID=1906581 RepID=UPI00272D4D30
MSIAQNQAVALAKQFNIQGDPQELVETLKATAFRSNATDAQFNVLMIVANQYGLNPFTKEIYAFPDKNNGITPVVGVDGWVRIINSHPQFDGMEFTSDAESCTCKIYRKDRNHPTTVTEYLEECRRDTKPWGSHPRRMLRHKAMIQAARLAFGFGGIYDEDEAERIETAESTKEQKKDPELDSLIADGEAAANKGMEEYKKWFTQIGAAGRLNLGSENHERFKQIAANTIEAETVEPSKPAPTEEQFTALVEAVSTGMNEVAEVLEAYTLTEEQAAEINAL